MLQILYDTIAYNLPLFYGDKLPIINVFDLQSRFELCSTDTCCVLGCYYVNKDVINYNRKCMASRFTI